MTRNAFFYDSRYWLLPDDCATVDELNARHRDGVSFTVTELVEKKCMAPYFVIENTKQKKLKLKKKAPVFPVTVELMTQKAYNQKLRELVPDVCKSCPNFEAVDETDESLDGHHEEVSLDGVCFMCNSIKDKHDDYKPMDKWLKNAVRDFGTLGLEELLDEGNSEGAVDIFKTFILGHIFEPLPVVWADKQENGRYRLMFTALLSEETAMITEAVFDALRKKYGKTWDFVSGIPAGHMCPEAAKPLYMTAEPVESPRPYVNLTVYYQDDADDDSISDSDSDGDNDNDNAFAAFLWMCGYYGETHLMSNLFAYAIKPADGSRPDDAMEPDDPAFADMLTQLSASDDGSLADRYPVTHIVPEFPGDIPDDATEEDVLRQMTLCSYRCSYVAMNFASPVAWGEIPGFDWDRYDAVSEMGMPLARLVFTHVPVDFTDKHNGSDTDKQLLDAFLELTKYLGEHHLSAGFEQRVSVGGGLEHWSVVFNLASYLYAIRRFAPLFERYPAELYIYTASGKGGGHYKPGFMMKRVETEGRMRKKLKPAE